MVCDKRKKRIVKICVSAFAAVLVLLVIAPYSISAIVLSAVFDRRFETEDYLRFSVSDFEGLRSERYVFSSDGERLVGYLYTVPAVEQKGVIVSAHGFGGGGHNGYLDVSYYFASRGYSVFGYDATGNDESGGKVGGLERGVKDIRRAIACVRGIESVSSLPLMLFGHSWGGYSATCALKYEPEVKAVAAIAPFNAASDMIEIRGVEYGGEASRILLPYVRSVERIKFGEYASLCGAEAAKGSTAGVFIAHGTEDESVPIRYGYDAFYKALSSDARCVFEKCEGKGHTDVLYSDEGREYMLSLEREIAACKSAEERAAVMKNIDRKKLASRLNTELFEKVVTFYDEYTLKS